MAEKYELKWTDFQQYLPDSLSLLRSSSKFTDVTLVSSDNKCIKAHQVILSSSSEYFNNVLTENSHPHPLICLDGINSEELKQVVEYMYSGEVKVEQAFLDRFMTIAKKFELIGLFKESEEKDDSKKAKIDSKNDTKKGSSNLEYNELPANKSPEEVFTKKKKAFRKKDTIDLLKIEKKEIKDDESFQSDAGKYHDMFVCNMSPDEVNNRGDLLIMKERGIQNCKDCGYVSTVNTHMREHVERHMEGLNYSCLTCEKILHTKKNMRAHILRYHSNK